jgi:hypothetical protein
MRLLPLVLLLAACGGKSEDPVVLLRLERDPGARAASIQKLLDLGQGETGLWERLLSEEDPEIARLAAAALGRAAGRDGWEEPPGALLDVLLVAARRKEPPVRAEAIEAIARLWTDTPQVPAKMAPFLVDPDPRARRAAIRAFRAFGPATAGLDLSPIAAILRGDPALALDAALALAACGDGSPETLERVSAAATNAVDPAMAVEATRALDRLGPRGAAAAPRLAAALPGAPEALASDLARCLGSLGNSSPPVVSALEKALGHRSEGVSLQAALSLARLGKAGPKAEEVLLAVRAKPPSRPRVHAAEGLALLGKDPDGETAYLASTVADPSADTTTRTLAAEALGRLAAAGRATPADADAALRVAARTGPLELRRAARRALAAADAR